jgi:ABC-type microcin C transport system duplicated ATPase subunit YejF
MQIMLSHVLPNVLSQVIVLATLGLGKRALPKMQIVFQDPLSSLDPHMSVKKILSETLRVNKLATGRDLEQRVLELLERVGPARLRVIR